MTKRPIIATFLVCMLAAFAQQTPPKTDTQTPPPADQKLNGVLVPNSGYHVSTTTQLVIETVFVKDKKGNPVPGLKKEDFAVSEDGKPHDIKIFD